MSKDKDNFDPDADLNDLINDEKSAKNPNQQKSLSDNVDVERLIDEQQSREQIESPSEPVYSDRAEDVVHEPTCLLYTSPSPRDQRGSRMPSSA